MVELRRAYVRELQRLECDVVRSLVDDPWLSSDDEKVLRWALSLARVSSVVVRESEGAKEEVVEIGHATDGYRTQLFKTLQPNGTTSSLNQEVIRSQIPLVHQLLKKEQEEILHLFGARLPRESFMRSIRERPLALAMGGGGGTAYVYLGALQLLDEAGITPAAIAGTSMGAILAAFRCKEKPYSMANNQELLSRLRWRNVFRLFDSGSRFGLPATLKLHLREVLGHEFEKEGRFLTLQDLAIPLRVCVAGLTNGERNDVDRYAHLLDDMSDVKSMRGRAAQIVRTLGEITREPVKAMYLGGDSLTQEFDVLDAIGFSSAVPGVVHYDVLRDDPRMVDLCHALREREGVTRFIDGGLADNLPAEEAWRAIQSGATKERDPFVLALDGFAPRLSTRHMLFLPLMRIAAENSKRGKKSAHLTVTFKNVLSPLNVVPTPDEFVRAAKNGREEMLPHIPFIRKMVAPLTPPEGL